MEIKAEYYETKRVKTKTEWEVEDVVSEIMRYSDAGCRIDLWNNNFIKLDPIRGTFCFAKGWDSLFLMRDFDSSFDEEYEVFKENNLK